MTPLGWLGRKTSTQTNKQIHKLNNKQCRSRSVGQLIWIYTVCKGGTHPGSAGYNQVNCAFLKEISLHFQISGIFTSNWSKSGLAVINIASLFTMSSDWRPQTNKQIHKLNNKQCRSRSVGQLIWIYTVCKGGTHPGSAGYNQVNCAFLKEISLHFQISGIFTSNWSKSGLAVINIASLFTMSRQILFHVADLHSAVGLRTSDWSSREGW